MKRIGLLLVLVLLLVPQASPAGSNQTGFGAGIIVGEPTGLTFKNWLSQGSALQGAVAWSTSSNANLHLHLDYIVHRFGVIDVSDGSMPIYFGIGARLRLRDNVDDQIGIRVPIGIDYQFASEPFDIFLEVVPILELSPDTDFGLNAALGGRWFF
jgi:hypothetical protein